MRWLIERPVDDERSFYAVGKDGVSLPQLVNTLQSHNPLWKTKSKWMNSQAGFWRIASCPAEFNPTHRTIELDNCTVSYLLATPQGRSASMRLRA